MAKISLGEFIIQIVDEYKDSFPEEPTFIECGSGLSTLYLAEAGRRTNATVFSIDNNAQKIDALKKDNDRWLWNVKFRINDSVKTIKALAALYGRIDLLILDSAPSALYTFNEFKGAERYLISDSIVLIDNATWPYSIKKNTRKGKILVPYIMAKSDWLSILYSHVGDSVIMARKMRTDDFADPDYEKPGEYIDKWQKCFKKELNKCVDYVKSLKK